MVAGNQSRSNYCMNKQAPIANHNKKTVDPELKELGNRIRALRIKAGYSSAEKFAVAHNISRNPYTRSEAGTNLTFKSLRKLLKIMGVSIKQFFDEGFE